MSMVKTVKNTAEQREQIIAMALDTAEGRFDLDREGRIREGRVRHEASPTGLFLPTPQNQALKRRWPCAE